MGTNPNVTDKVMEKIRGGKIKMKSAGCCQAEKFCLSCLWLIPIVLGAIFFGLYLLAGRD